MYEKGAAVPAVVTLIATPEQAVLIKQCEALDGYPFFVTKYGGQTKVKHNVLNGYFEKWAVILGKYYPLVFVDCCAGWGAYLGNNHSLAFGSSVIAAQIAQEKRNKGIRIEVVAIEREKENIHNLREVLKFLNVNSFVETIEGDYEASINKVIGKYRKKYKKCAFFIFIDPFGYKINAV